MHGIDFEINDGEFVVLVGPSGCGKSTILRMIAGLETVTGGEIVIDDRDRQRHAAARARYRDGVPGLRALSAHVGPPESRIRPEDARREAQRDRSGGATDRGILQIESLLERKPKALSGGQRQRVAIGRAIAREPGLFLFDEPLSNLDAKLRVDMRTQIKRLHLTFKTTSIYVTHDQVEAMTLADRIVILRSGVIEQIGTAADLYARAARIMFVAGFIGSPAMNFLDARLEATDGTGLSVVPDGGPALKLPRHLAERYGKHAGSKVVLGLRPEHLTNAWTDQDRGGLAALTAEGRDRGTARRRHVDLQPHRRAGDRLPHDARGQAPTAGAEITLQANMNHMHLFEPETGIAL